MALPTSGKLTLSQIQTEFGGSASTKLSEYYAGGAYVPAGTSGTNGAVPSSGKITISNFYGTAKASRVSISYTFSSNTANASLNLNAISGYSAGQSDITVTINSGIYLYSTSTGNAGLTLTGSTSGDTLTIVNNGYIMGMGGTGAGGVCTNPGVNITPIASTAGGPALSIPLNATINNTNGSAYIGGGGGGGGGYYFGGGYSGPTQAKSAGGGAGGGDGGQGAWTFSGQSAVQNTAGGAGGSIGSSGSNGILSSSNLSDTGGGGGRIFPSTSLSKTGTGPGLGNSGGGTGAVNASAVSTGGGPGQAGSAIANSDGCAGGGGGWGSSGGNSTTGGTANAGAIGGKAVNTNGNSVTWVSGDTTRVYGAVS
jgi:hypothetical protein